MKTWQLLLACGMLSMATTASATIHFAKQARHPVAQANKPAADEASKPEALRPSALSAQQIVDRNVAARGGLKAWQGVNTLRLAGQLEAGGVKNTPLPFVMEMKRPYKSRMEINFQGRTALQVYDGEHGWKVRPFLNRDEVESFTPEEAKLAASWQELDGPLMDYASKGTQIKVEGMDSVEGRDAYKLLLTMKTGAQRHLWIDAKNFLEIKIDGDPRRMDGRIRNVAVYYRDYRDEQGLMVPHTLETRVEGDKTPHKMTVEQVTVNLPLDEPLFEKPQLAMTASPSH